MDSFGGLNSDQESFILMELLGENWNGGCGRPAGMRNFRGCGLF